MKRYPAGFFVRMLSVVALLLSPVVTAAETVEEQRLPRAQRELVDVVGRHAELLEQFAAGLPALTNAAELESFVIDHADRLWRQARENVQRNGIADDRPLYWCRLAMSRLLRQQVFHFDLSDAERQLRLQQLERISRGMADVRYASAEARVFVTGFDPFRLDNAIDQSNPSGLAALALDGRVLSLGGREVRVEAVLIPVRFADFDQGLIEAVLTPILTDPNMQLVATISMGRSSFDLERFPGRRRSADAFDNANVKAGGTPLRPVLPLLQDAAIDGPEFVEFSLPVKKMRRVQQPYAVNDNGNVTTLAGPMQARNLTDLRYQTAVAGSGGGYLSNEISYRSLRLRDVLHLQLPVGHIHTPLVQGYDAEIEQHIVNQIEALLRAALQ